MARLSKLIAIATMAVASVHAQPTRASKGQPLARDFLVELRQVRDNGTDSSSTIWSSANGPTKDGWAQEVRVRHAEKASFQIQTSQPIQWLQSLQVQNSTLSAASASASTQSGSMTQALVWIESGQSWSVSPQWIGAKQPVRLDLEMKVAALRDSTGAELPAAQHQQLTTSVHAPLGQWVTLAATGQRAQRSTYSSQPGDQGRTLIQVRVSLP